MNRFERSDFLDSPLEGSVNPPRRRKRQQTTRRRRRVDLWAGGTILLALSLLLTASFFYAPPSTGAPDARAEPALPQHDRTDLALADEFIVTDEDETVFPDSPDGQNVTPVSAPVQPLSADATRTATVPATTETPAAPVFPSADLMAPDISEPAETLEEETFRLSQLPPASLRLDNEPLENAIAMIADSAGMSYATNGVLEGQVTGALSGNPHRLLQNLSKAYAFNMVYNNGLWTFSSTRSPSQQRPIRKFTSKSYTITNNMLERMSMRDSLTGGGAGGIGRRNNLASSGSAGQGGAGTSMLTSANMLAGHTVFEANYNRIIDDLRQLLQATNPIDEGPQPSVFLNEDGNSLLAVGAESDHQLITAYLANFDQPQRAVSLEVKLVRTKRNPSSLIGVDWGNGVKVDLSGTFDEGKFTLDRLVGGLGGAPTGVLLTNSEANITLDAIQNDSLTQRISFIEKMTLDNREVVLANVIEEPVISGREEVEAESGLRVLVDIDKEIIGTVINILPRIMADNNIKMRLRLEDSNIVRFKQFFEDSSGGEYPVISKQTYEGPVVVKDGFSLAITGFETTEEVMSTSSVPILGDIPFVGRAFSHESTREERSYLVIFITPRIMEDATEGVDYLNRNHHLGRSQPLGPIAGTHFDSFSDLERYVYGIRHQHDELMQVAALKGVTTDLIDEANFLYTELEALSSQLQSFFDRGVEQQKVTRMLEFCDEGITNTWRILQQDRPSFAATPLELVHRPKLGDSATYETAKSQFKRETKRERERRRSPLFTRRKGH